mmetsp:Transcript_11982/g.26649  ORF Transcript_11982/g.26649 Transcript_11982/m.26649 type:complete len:246 (-) Transcript_11982:1549-2286(-)
MAEGAQTSNNDNVDNRIQSPPPEPPIISPALFLLGASLPFALGAYSGYRREVKRAAAGGENYNPGSSGGGGGGKGSIVSRLMEGQEPATRSSKRVSTAAAAGEMTASRAVGGLGVNPVGPVLAARALIIGSMLSIGGVGLMSAAIFYSSGYETVDEAVRSLREWGPRKRREWERFVGLPEGGQSASHPDVIATKGMSEDEELEYVKRKYLHEVYEEDGASDVNGEEAGGTGKSNSRRQSESTKIV